MKEVFVSSRLTGTLLVLPAQHVHSLEMNGENYLLRGSREKDAPQTPGGPG